eukprot:scaffold276216_cov40-Tisochrysis_lutea.AAC.4
MENERYISGMVHGGARGENNVRHSELQRVRGETVGRRPYRRLLRHHPSHPHRRAAAARARS